MRHMESKPVLTYFRFGQFLFESLLNLAITGRSGMGLSGSVASAGCAGAFRWNE